MSRVGTFRIVDARAVKNFRKSVNDNESEVLNIPLEDRTARKKTHKERRANERGRRHAVKMSSEETRCRNEKGLLPKCE